MADGLPPAPPTPAGGASPAKKPVWKRWWFWVVAVLVLLFLVSLGDTGVDETGAGNNGEATTDGDGGDGDMEEQPGIGDPVGDGQFTFTVTKVKCGEEVIGSGLTSAQAQGEFCLVDVTVENTGDQAQMMDASSQYAYIGDTEYSTTSDALLALPEAQQFFLEEINPGNEVSGTLVFDMPPDSKPERLELHDSPFSGGVSVYL